MGKTNFTTWYDTLNEKKGTEHERESLVNRESEKDTNINYLIQKYGVEALMLKDKPENQLYIDTSIYDEYDINTILNERQRIEEYYNGLPSKVRKSYADNFENFWEKVRNGELDDFITKGILTEEHANAVKEYIEDNKKAYKQSIIDQYKLEKEIKAELETEKGDTNGI